MIVLEYLRSKGGAVVRALASHQCGPGSIHGVDAICGLSFLLVLSQQQQQQQQFIQLSNNLSLCYPQLAELFQVGNNAIIVSYKVGKA